MVFFNKERGFALTEVLVSVFLLILVSGAFLQLVVGSTNAQTAMKVRQKQQTVAESLVEHLRVDSSWTDDCVESGRTAVSDGDDAQPAEPCDFVDVTDIYKNSSFTKDNDGNQYGISAKAYPIDSAGDGLGAADKDKSTVDFFRVDVSVNVPDSLGKQVRQLKTSSIIDPFSSNAVGSVEINVCKMPKQTDDRAVYASCSNVDMDDTGLENVDDRSTFQYLVDNDSIKTQVEVLPVKSIKVVIKGLDDSNSNIKVTAKTDNNGKVNAKLKPGRYEVEVDNPAGGFELWKEKSLPTTPDSDGSGVPKMTINVQPYQETNGLVALRKKVAPDFNIRVEMGQLSPRDESTFKLGVPRDVAFKLIPMPLGRAPIADAYIEKKPEDGKLVTFVTAHNVAPGLYRPLVVNKKKGLEQLELFESRGAAPPRYTKLKYIWLGDSSGSNNSYPSSFNPLSPNTGNAAVYRVGQYVEVDSGEEPPPVTSYPISPMPAADIACQKTWRNMKNALDLFSGRKLPGVRRCIVRGVNMCPGVYIDQAAWGSTATITCGKQSQCTQYVKMTDGIVGWLGFTPGGVANVNCYPNAKCQQTGGAWLFWNGPVEVMGAGAVRSEFNCLQNSTCKQRLSKNTQSGLVGALVGMWNGLWAGDGGRVVSNCYDNSSCNQASTVPTRGDAIQNCFPSGKCEQNTKVFYPPTQGAVSRIECHPNATCKQKAEVFLPVLNGVVGRELDAFFSLFNSNIGKSDINILCYKQGSCEQTALAGSFSYGHWMRCFPSSTCKQYTGITTFMTNGLSSLFGKNAKSETRQDCFSGTACDQRIVRTSPAAGFQQLCYKPRIKQPPLINVKDTACVESDAGARFDWWFFKSLYGIDRGIIQDCGQTSTNATCTQTITVSSFLNFGASNPYQQVCMSKLDCKQSMTRSGNLFSIPGVALQTCLTTDGKCDQMMHVQDDSPNLGSMIFGGIFGPMEGKLRKQSCDSRSTQCKQYMSGANVAWYDLSWLGGGLNGTKNPVMQECNYHLNYENYPEDDPAGNYDPSSDGSGGV